MRHSINYHQLFQIETDLKEITKQSPALSFLLNSTINRFYQRASMHLRSMNSNMDRLQKKYEVVGEDGKLSVNEESKEIVWKPEVVLDDRTVVGEEVKKAYIDELNIFMERHCEIDM